MSIAVRSLTSLDYRDEAVVYLPHGGLSGTLPALAGRVVAGDESWDTRRGAVFACGTWAVAYPCWP